ncbi:hypothetical protein DSO57_1015218 [Entomophthora muscae]|uniref:Uncharacterized protein n=1 Tax=Entomophthora muscae TaxID=34485 RepID=A0ACC2TSN2_9FUNG|nr:hypothetical protein DSO57_1015218 [Entomophthora muscae]
MASRQVSLVTVTNIPSYDYRKIGFTYFAILGLAEQVIPHMGVWRPWATAANYAMRMVPVIYWAFQARPFPSTKVSPESNLGHDMGVVFSYLLSEHDSFLSFSSKLWHLEIDTPGSPSINSLTLSLCLHILLVAGCAIDCFITLAYRGSVGTASWGPVASALLAGCTCLLFGLCEGFH